MHTVPTEVPLGASSEQPFDRTTPNDAVARARGHCPRFAMRLGAMMLPHAAARGAALVEPHDLSRAVRDFAIPLGWIDRDPFSTRSGGGR